MVEVLKKETKSLGEGLRFKEIVEENFPEFKNVMPWICSYNFNLEQWLKKEPNKNQ